MTSTPLRASDLVERWYPGAIITMHTNALAELSSANAVAWFDDERIANQAIAVLRSVDDAASFAVVVFRPTDPTRATDGLARITAPIESSSLGRQIASLGSMWALAFSVVAAISFDGVHALAVATTVTVLIGGFGAVPFARTRRATDGESHIHLDRRLAVGRLLTMVTVLADDRASAHCALERWWNLAAMSAVVDERGRLC